MKFLSAPDVPSLAVAANATTPVPDGGAGSIIWSTTAVSLLVWDGSKWAAIGSGGGGAATFDWGKSLAARSGFVAL